MLKGTSLAWKRPGLSLEEFRHLCLGEHAELAKRLPGLREYVIDFVTEGPEGAPDGIATLRFDNREALEHAFSDARLNEDVTRTRRAFASAVQVTFVDTHVVVGVASKALVR